MFGNFAEIIGNRVKVPGDPVTVNGEYFAAAIVRSQRWSDEKVRNISIRKPGSLLNVNGEVSSAESNSFDVIYGVDHSDTGN